MSSAEGRPYHVSFPGKAFEQLQRLETAAMSCRCLTRFQLSLEQSVFAMRDRPYEWGDPLFRIPKLKLLMCRGRADLLYVIYGVHDVESSVFVHDVVADPFGPLASAG